MASGDVVRGDDGKEYVVVWSGQHGEFSLLGPREQRTTQLYANGDVDGRPFRRGSGADRLVYRRRRKGSEKS